MSVFIIKSTVITNRDATPKVLTDAYLSGGLAKSVEGYVQTATGADGAGSTYTVLTVPSNSRLESLKFQTSGLGTSCTLDIGVAYPTFIPVGSGLSAANAGTVINTTLFVSATAASNAVAATDLITTANVAINKQELQLWAMAGLTSDPGIDLDIFVNVHVAVALQGYIGLKATYVF